MTDKRAVYELCRAFFNTGNLGPMDLASVECRKTSEGLRVSFTMKHDAIGKLGKDAQPALNKLLESQAPTGTD